MEQYARRYGDGFDLSLSASTKHTTGIANLMAPVFHVNAFSHPFVPLRTNLPGYPVALYRWGLIPHWATSEITAQQLRTPTFNAKCETLFDKPSFRQSVESKRCIVMVDGFFEHHFRGGKPFPYHITGRDDEPLSLAGIWDTWNNPETGEVESTFSILTTRANELMSSIHNNPKNKEPRMPVIVDDGNEKLWLESPVGTRAIVKEISKPYPSDRLHAYPVRRLRGKEYAGNSPSQIQPFYYPELNSLFDH